jgi:predicted kinase
VGVPAVFVVVSGPPGSGKTTLAVPLARQLHLPLIAKDTIKEALMTALGTPDVDASRRLGAAAVQVMLAVASESSVGAVIEANLRRSVAVGELGRLPGRVVEVFCRCDPEVARARYLARAGTRHAGHFDDQRTDGELWQGEVAEPVAGGWPLLEVDTAQPVDVGVVVAFVRDRTRLSAP